MGPTYFLNRITGLVIPFFNGKTGLFIQKVRTTGLDYMIYHMVFFSLIENFAI